MAYRYTCDICERTFKADSRSEMIDKAQEHAERQHEMTMSRSDVGEDIVEED